MSLLFLLLPFLLFSILRPSPFTSIIINDHSFVRPFQSHLHFILCLFPSSFYCIEENRAECSSFLISLHFTRLIFDLSPSLTPSIDSSLPLFLPPSYRTLIVDSPSLLFAVNDIRTCSRCFPLLVSHSHEYSVFDRFSPTVSLLYLSLSLFLHFQVSSHKLTVSYRKLIVGSM